MWYVVVIVLAVGCCITVGVACGLLWAGIARARHDHPDGNALYAAVQASKIGQRLLAIMARTEPGTKTELQVRVIEADELRETMATRGWKAFVSRMEVKTQLQKEAGYALSPNDFISARGLQQKGIVLGTESALQEAAQMIVEGEEARKYLEELETRNKQKRDGGASQRIR